MPQVFVAVDKAEKEFGKYSERKLDAALDHLKVTSCNSSVEG